MTTVDSKRLGIPDKPNETTPELRIKFTTPHVIHGQRPPNFEAIAAVFPDAHKPAVIFAYGHVVYTMSPVKLSRALIAHESIHCERQLAIGVEVWWERYLTDTQFRFNEELLAHRAEYRQAIIGVKNSRGARGPILSEIAQRLSSSLYGNCVSYEQAKKAIPQ